MVVVVVVVAVVVYSVPEIHSHVAGTLSNKQTNKHIIIMTCDCYLSVAVRPCWEVKQPANNNNNKVPEL